MKKHFFQSVFVAFCLFMGMTLQAKEIYVATTGSDSNSGTEQLPFASIQKGIDEAAPGDIIYVRGGTYKPTKRIIINKAGTKDARICLFGYPGETAVIDGSNMNPTSVNEFKQSRCIYVNHFGDYWHFKNLELCNALDNGMKIEGSYNIVENCKFHDNNDTGLQIGMYKDFSIEETKSFPISGSPEFNPNYTYCRNNVVINCDSYYNYDSKAYGGGSDDGGDADGFAAKLFPGPGTEFIGCRAWNNSDDNWDLYMVYHPILIENCWSYKAGYDKNGTARQNGNGFKLGGGGTSGGIGFDQSIGAHVVRNCVSFGSLHKGFDQNNAYEGMYILNNLSFDNEFNYRFPTEFKYGGMYMRNNVGFNASKENHEFLSEGKAGAQVPNTNYNSWTTLDGCSPYKESTKVPDPNTGKNVNVYTKDYRNEFKSLSAADFMAPRQADGSLPDNGFAQLKEGSVLVDKGQIIENFAPAHHIPANLLPLDYVDISNITIDYLGQSADMGPYELGDPTKAKLDLVSGNTAQTVYTGTAITPITYKWGGATTDVSVTDIPDGIGLIVEKDPTTKTVVISGNPTASVSYTVTTVDGESPVTLTGTITVSTIAPGTLECISSNINQIVNIGAAIQPIEIEWGGGATDVTLSALPAGLQSAKSGNKLTISGTPSEDGNFTVETVGGMTPLSLSGSITRVIPTKVLTGDWYHIQDALDDLPIDLKGVIALSSGSDTNYPTVWDPTYTEKGTVPSGCTTGAINLERGGSITWTLPNLVELKSNIHFTGSRTLKIEYTVDGETKTWTSSSYSKQTMTNWNMMAAIGLEPTTKPVTIKFYHTATNGGLRMYDFYVKVYDEENGNPTDVQIIPEKVAYDFYQTETALIVYGEIASLQVFNLSGQLVAQTQMSQVVNTAGLSKGLYIVKVNDKNGASASFKFVK